MFIPIKKISLSAFLCLGVGLVSFTTMPLSPDAIQDVSDETPVWDVMEDLGKIKVNALNDQIQGVSAQKGADIIFKGYSTKKDGSGTTKLQSPYFKCTACHNPEREYKDLADINAKDRLQYAIDQDMPFLQGSSFYGIVNRTTFYNDDYQKKYGGVPQIKASFNDIRTAIKFCATQCAQGRELEDWEVESILAYFWTKELKIGDLKLDKEEKEKVTAALETEESTARALHILEDHYLKSAPAHFAENDIEYKALSEKELADKAAFANGKEIYERSCLHCHGRQEYSFFHLDDSPQAFQYLINKTKKGDKNSIFKITRHGTYSLNGKKSYMPQFPIEKMSDRQLKDLRIYVENMANGKNLMQ